MTRHKLKALKPRIPAATSRLKAAAMASSEQRLRGRAGVERRARWLSEHQLCAECLKTGRATAACTPDHIVPLHLGGADDDSNLQSLCDPCHAEKTAREASARARGTTTGCT